MKHALVVLFLWALSPAGATQAQGTQMLLRIGTDATSGAEQLPEAVTVWHLDQRQRLSGGDSFAMIATGSAVALGIAGFAIGVDSPWPLAVAPLISGVAVGAVGDGRGHDGSVLAAVGGALVGGAAGGAILYVSLDNVNVFSGEGYGEAALGTLVYLTLPSILGTVGYSVSMGSHSAPAGQRVPTVGVQIGL